MATLEGRHIVLSRTCWKDRQVGRGQSVLCRGDPTHAAADGARPSSLRVPRTVHDAVQQRVERLAAPARRAASLASVIGREFDLGLLQRLLNWDEEQLLQAMADLVGAELVVERAEETHFTFRHELTRQAIYSDLLGHERRRLHAQLVSSIEQELERGDTSAHVEDLADQAFAAQDWQRTLIYAARASERALACSPHARQSNTPSTRCRRRHG